MTRKLLIASAIAISFAAVPAMAGGITIDQFGFGNAAGGSQVGFDNDIGVFQNGLVNTG
ncbi:MAG: curlin, partial [Hyphomicrobiales bacterium]|nr:curlin [Hyphomicrobiales bacterium]